MINLMRFSEIANILNTEPKIFDNDSEIEFLLTDSRRLSIADKTLFFSITTVNGSANKYIPGLFLKGVKNFIVDNSFNDFKGLENANMLVVENVIDALQKISAFHRKAFSYDVIGITGSNGKTIVKEWLSILLSGKFNIVKSPRSYNSQIGVPLSVWKLNAAANLGIFEAGISLPGEMEKLEKIIKPSIGIFTSVGDAHSSGFSNLTEKLREKLKLFAHCKKLIYCSDIKVLDSEVNLFLKEKNPDLQAFTWGHNYNSNLKILLIERVENSTKILCGYNNNEFEFFIPFTNDAAVENAMSCVATLIILGISIFEIPSLLSGLPAMEMRLELIEGANNCSVINDSYSIDLHSIEVALNFLSRQNQHSKRTVILSDLDDLNTFTATRINQMLVASAVSRLFLIGKAWQEIVSFNDIPEIIHYNSTDDLLNDFENICFSNETILLKGRRVYEFERISYLLEKKSHESVLEIDLHAIKHNLAYFRKLAGKSEIMAMVKAFGYGAGGFEIANILQHAGISYLAVAYADEGVDLRTAGITMPVMVMNTEENSFFNIVKYNLEPEIYSLNILKSFIKFLKFNKKYSYPVHIKFDTGMHRLGFEEGDLKQLSDIISNNDEIKVVSVFSHLSASDDPSKKLFTERQFTLFNKMCDFLMNHAEIKFKRHISNSSAIAEYPQYSMDMVRLGIGLFGVGSTAEIQNKLLNVGTLRTTISQIRKVKAGDIVGYGANNVLKNDRKIATVRIGYADGYHRSLGNGKGKMIVNKNVAPTVGNICMDMTMLDVTGIDCSEGDDVIVLGEEMPVSEVAKAAGTISYEILTGISQRVKRVYIDE